MAVALGGAMTVASWGFSPAAHAHGSCRPPAGAERVSEVTASSRVRCGTARKVAAAYDGKVMQSEQFPGSGRISANGFACATRPVSGTEETFKVRCWRNGGHVVHFVWGV